MLTAALGICWREVRLLYESLCWVKKMPSPAYCSLEPAWGFPETTILKGRAGSHTVSTLVHRCEGALYLTHHHKTHPVFWQLVCWIDSRTESAPPWLNKTPENACSRLTANGVAQHTPSPQRPYQCSRPHQPARYAPPQPLQFSPLLPYKRGGMSETSHPLPYIIDSCGINLALILDSLDVFQ